MNYEENLWDLIQALERENLIDFLESIEEESDEEYYHEQEEETLLDHQRENIDEDLDEVDGLGKEFGVNKEGPTESGALPCEAEVGSILSMDIEFRCKSCEIIEKGDNINP